LDYIMLYSNLNDSVRFLLRNCKYFFSSRRRHTRSKRDWSSDVCSSDLHLCGDAQCQSVTDECPSSGMGAQQRVFGCNGVYTLTALVVGLAYRLVDFRKFSQFFQVVVHL